MADDYPRLPSECVELTVRVNGRRRTFFAKPLPRKKPGIRTFIRVNDQGESRWSYDAKKNVETKHVDVWVVADSDIVSEKPCVYSCKYACLEPA